MRPVMCCLSLFFSGSLSLVSAAATQEATLAPVLIRSGPVFDSRRAVMLPARDILVRGDTIVAIEQEVQSPKDAVVIDLRAYTLLPGLIDAHTHLLLEVDPYAAITPDVVAEGEARRALRGAVHARSYLNSGFTTVRDLGNAGLFADVALKRAIHDGHVEGPRMYVSGPGLSAVEGQVEGTAERVKEYAAKEYRIILNVADARTAVRDAVSRGADLIKVYADQRPKPGALSPDELRAIVDEAHKLGVRVAAHATSDAPALRAVEAGVDSIEHAYELSDTTLRLIKERGVIVIPTFIDLDTEVIGPMARKRVPSAPAAPAGLVDEFRGRLRRLFDSGASVVAGSDMYWNVGLPRGDAAKRVLFVYAQAGIEPGRILQAATRNAALLIGEPRLGIIEAGAFADIIAIEGNPLADFSALERVRFVMKNGTIVSR